MKDWITAKKAPVNLLEKYVYDQLYGMLSGKGKLDRLQGDRYLNIQPRTVKQFFMKQSKNLKKLKA